MKRIFAALMMVLVFVWPLTAFANPPTSIDLSYDQSNGALHVEAVHPSFNLDKSYVRLMNVYVNGQQALTKDYFRQEDNNKFTDDVQITAQVGDVVKVDLFCTLGGELAQEMKIGPGISQTSQQKEDNNAAG